MNDAKEYIKSKHNGEIPYKYGADECARLMETYAKYYHEREVKKLRLADVVGRSEQCLHLNKLWTINQADQRVMKCQDCGGVDV